MGLFVVDQMDVCRKDYLDERVLDERGVIRSQNKRKRK